MRMKEFLNEAPLPVYAQQERLKCCYNCKHFDVKSGNWSFVCGHQDFKGVSINPVGVCIKFSKG
jgi:hypothetical protein